LPPTLEDFGDLLPGSMVDGISIYRDGQGGATFVKSVVFDPAIPLPTDQ
jgi:hypothetical protein